MSYGSNFDDRTGVAAVYVDKILKGAKPADLPVQQATKFEFVINLKAAKQIGLTLSPEFLARANQGHQVILILLTTGTTARRVASRSLKQVGCIPGHRTSPS